MVVLDDAELKILAKQYQFHCISFSWGV